MHDADIGHRGLGQHACHISRDQSRLERRPRSLNSTTLVVTAGSTGGPMLPGRGPGCSVGVKRDEGLIHRAVIAPVEDQNLGASCDLPRQADGESVRVGGGERELPVGQAESLLQFFGDENRVFAGQHQRDAAPHLLFDGFDGGDGESVRSWRRCRRGRNRCSDVRRRRRNARLALRAQTAERLRPISPSSSWARRRAATCGRARTAPSTWDARRRTSSVRVASGTAGEFGQWISLASRDRDKR